MCAGGSPVFILLGGVVNMCRCLVVCAFVVLIVGGYNSSYAQTVTTSPSAIGRNGLHYSLGIQKFINSFTSYQFPNPFPPEQDPLSRLEFPLDQWFLGIFSGFSAQSWVLSGELWVNLNRESRKHMQDSYTELLEEREHVQHMLG